MEREQVIRTIMIVVERLKGIPVGEHRVELVERKGKGHPDYMCDSIMDAISVSVCGAYMKEFGTILHHNIDKGLLAAGRTIKAFGSGEVLQPMEVIIGDRGDLQSLGEPHSHLCYALFITHEEEGSSPT